MKTYNTQQEVEKDIVNGVLKINDDVIFNCNIEIKADIICHNIKAYNINVYNINAYNINAENINVYDINTLDINASNINAENINTSNINAKNINTLDINANNIYALDINASNINYYAVCFAYKNIKCNSIKGRKINNKHFCLDGNITIKKQLIKIETKDGQVISITKEKAKELGFNIN